MVVVPKTGNTAKMEPTETVSASLSGVIPCFNAFIRGVINLFFKYDFFISPPKKIETQEFKDMNTANSQSNYLHDCY